MITPSLINLAILAYFAFSSGHGVDFDFHAGKKATYKVEEKVVLRESTLSEKCGLGLEAVSRPDTEIVALSTNVRRISSALGLDKKIASQAVGKPLFDINKWNGRFQVRWDDHDGGVYFEDWYYPTCEAIGDGVSGCFEARIPSLGLAPSFRPLVYDAAGDCLGPQKPVKVISVEKLCELPNPKSCWVETGE